MFVSQRNYKLCDVVAVKIRLILTLLNNLILY